MMSKQNVPELRFPEFSGEWEERKVEAIAEVLIGLTYSPQDIENDGLLVLRSSNIKDNRIALEDKVYVNKNIPEKLYIKRNDLLLCSRNGSRRLIGKSVIINKEMPRTTFGAFMAVVRSHNNIFLNALFNTTKFKKQVHENLGARINQITTKNLKDMKFHFPQEDEQKKIGDFFSKLDRLIELEEKKLELLEEQKKGYMQKIFSQELRFKDENGNDYPEWEEKNLEDMGVTYTGLSGKTKENFGVGDAQFITYKNVFDYLFADVRGIQQVEIKEDEKQSSVRKNDILFTTSSETPEEVGMASIWSYETSNTYLNSFCFGYRLEDYEVSAEFLAISLRQEYMRRKITLLGQGSTRFNLSKREVMKLSVFIPCLQEQFKITDLYKKMMYRIDMKKEKINSLKRRKEGLLQNLFI